MKRRQVSLSQWATRLARRVFPSPVAEPAPAEPAPRMLTAQSIQSRLAAKNIPLRSTLRVVWVRPSSEEGEWEIFHPFSKAPLSVYEDMLHAAEVAVELVGLEGGGSVGLLDADGESLNEVAVPPADDEGTSQPPATP